MKYYKTINEISVYDFFKIIDTDNILYLLKKRSSKNINEKQMKILSSAFDEIQNEYNILLADKKSIDRMKALGRIKIMKVKWDCAIQLIDLYTRYGDVKLLETLNELGFKFKKEDNIQEQIQRITKRLTGIKNRLKIAQVNFTKKYTDTSEEEKEPILNSLDKMAMNLELSLELKYHINPKKTKLIRWCNLINTAKERQEAYEQAKV